MAVCSNKEDRDFIVVIDLNAEVTRLSGRE